MELVPHFPTNISPPPLFFPCLLSSITVFIHSYPPKWLINALFPSSLHDFMSGSCHASTFKAARLFALPRTHCLKKINKYAEASANTLSIQRAFVLRGGGRTVRPLTFFLRVGKQTWERGVNSQRTDKRRAETVELSNSATKLQLWLPPRVWSNVGVGEAGCPRRMLMWDKVGQLRRLEKEDGSVWHMMAGMINERAYHQADGAWVISGCAFMLAGGASLEL